MPCRPRRQSSPRSGAVPEARRGPRRCSRTQTATDRTLARGWTARRRPLRRRFVVGRRIRIRRVDDDHDNDDDPPTMALVLLGGLPGFEYGRVAFVALALPPLPFILDMVVVVACSRSCFFLLVVMTNAIKTLVNGRVVSPVGRPSKINCITSHQSTKYQKYFKRRSLAQPAQFLRSWRTRTKLVPTLGLRTSCSLIKEHSDHITRVKVNMSHLVITHAAT